MVLVVEDEDRKGKEDGEMMKMLEGVVLLSNLLSTHITSPPTRQNELDARLALVMIIRVGRSRGVFHKNSTIPIIGNSMDIKRT